MLQVINVMPSTILSFALMLLGIVSIVLSMFKRPNSSNDIKSIILCGILLISIVILYISAHHIKLHIIHILLVFLLVCMLQIHFDFNSSRVSNYSVYFLVITAIVATLFASEAKNFITLYLSFEAISFVGYVLVALLIKKNLTSEGAVKYFVIGGVSSAMMIFGISFIYGISNSIDFSSIIFDRNGLIVAGFIFFFIGILFKLAAFPLHFWAPDVYSIANLPSLSVIAILPKIAALLALANIIHYIDSKVLVIILFCAIISMIVGSLGAIFQTNIQKILAYSGIANIGYVFSLYSLDIFNISVILEFIVIYSISVIFVLMILVNINKNFGYDGTIYSLRGLYKTNPILAVFLTLALLNIAGIPPLSGFFAKYIVVSQLLQVDSIVLPFAILASSVVTLFYYLKIIKNMYFDSPSKELELYKGVIVSSGSKICIGAILLFISSYAYLGYNTKYQTLVQNFYKQDESIKVIS